MANRYCTRCGKELIEGKRFCGGCGLAAPEPAPVVESVPRCSRCAGELMPGKPFCHLCGQAIASPAADLESAVPDEAQIPDPPPAAPAIFVPELTPVESAPAVTIQYSDWETVHPGGLSAAGSFTAAPPGAPSATAWDEPAAAPRVEDPHSQLGTEVEPIPSGPDSNSESEIAAAAESEAPSAPLLVPVFEPEQTIAPDVDRSSEPEVELKTQEDPPGKWAHEIEPSPKSHDWKAEPEIPASPESETPPPPASVPAFEPEPAPTPIGAYASEPGVATEAENGPPAQGTLAAGQDWNREPAKTEATTAETLATPPPAAPALAPVAAPPPPRKSGLAIQMGIAAALILGALGYWAWHVYANRQTTATVSTIATAANPTPQASTPAATPSSGESAAQPDTQPAIPASSSTPSQDSNPVAEEAASQSAKPSAGVPLAPAPTSNAEAAQQPSAPSHVVLPDSSRSAHGNPAAPTPVFHQSAVPATAQTAAQATPPRSGVLHYQGPPIHPGGIVVFDRLPKGRLKFTFDRSLWQQPLIQRNPDGTQRLTLHSSQQSDQSACDVGWEITE